MDSARLEARRPHKVCTPFKAEVADGSRRKMLLPADGAMVQADPEYRESLDYVRFMWGTTWLLADVATFRNSTRDLLRQAQSAP
jgi:hypothetical protein